MDYYLSIRDIQMLGMLSCVLAHPSLPDSFKPPKIHPKSDVITSSKSFTYGSSPHCAEVTYQVSNHREGMWKKDNLLGVPDLSPSGMS